MIEEKKVSTHIAIPINVWEVISILISETPTKYGTVIFQKISENAININIENESNGAKELKECEDIEKN